MKKFTKVLISSLLCLGMTACAGSTTATTGSNEPAGNAAGLVADGVDFILFDLMIGSNYQSRESVERCASAFGLNVIPIVGEGRLEEAVSFVKKHPQSVMGQIDMEGIVCRPAMELRDRCGERIIVKIKWEDFRHFADGQADQL